MNYLLRNKRKVPRIMVAKSNLPKKIYMNRIVTRSMHRKFMNPARTIQRSWRQYQNIKGKTDPISLSPLTHPIFVAVTSDGHEYYFSAISLALYIEESGDYRNPYTREEFNTIEIRRLVRLSNVNSILDVEACKKQRIDRMQRDSLRAFFEEEVVSVVNNFVDYSRGHAFFNAGYLIRHMMALVFPTIMVTMARVVRNDPDFSDELLELLEGRSNLLSEALQSRPRTMQPVLNIYTQFIRDVRTQVEQNALVTGHIANFDAGGLAVQVDLQSI